MPLDRTGGALLDIPQAASAAAPVPWSIILPTVASLIGGLLGGDTEEEKKKKDIAQMEGYLSQFYMPSKERVGGMNQILTQAIMNNLGRYSDWGWPGSNSQDLRNLIGNYVGGGNVVTKG